jgi:transposase
VRTEYFITLDTHCRSSDACVKTTAGKLVKRERMATTIPALADFIRSVKRPRHLCFEEGPLAGWLYRSLRGEVDHIVVCDPRRNAYVGKDGDKDDPIDAEKLNDLFRAGLIREVHQTDCPNRAGFKQLVSAYHAAVRSRVAQANRLIALGKRWGLLWNTSLLLRDNSVNHLTGQLLAAAAPPYVLSILTHSINSIHQAVEAEESLHAAVVKITAKDELCRRLMALPGVREVRAATFVAYIDTPFRFKSKEALWKYCGIGLRRAKSGDGPEIVKVEQHANHRLRGVVIGAAEKTIEMIHNFWERQRDPDSQRPGKEYDDETIRPFAAKYGRWLESSVSPANARRNLARLFATCAWAMWKTGEPFHPQWIDQTS